MRKFAITDIHGCNITFHALLDQIALSTGDELFLLGDYIDRGPDSKGVLDTILHLKNEGYTVRCLMGNHENEMLNARQYWGLWQGWFENYGGRETMESFDVPALDMVPAEYWAFLESLELYIETESYLLVHAGLNWSALGNPFDNTGDELLFARNWYHHINYDWLGERIILHGHTPILRRDIEAQRQRLFSKKYLNLDNGCVYDRWGDHDYGLCAFDMENRELFFQKNLDDVSSYWGRE